MTIGTTMALLGLLFLCILQKSHGDPFPKPTPVARLNGRQDSAQTIWSPTVVGTKVSYVQYSDPGYTVSSQGDYWGFCSVGLDCGALRTTCEAGTLYAADASYVCPSSASLCGTNYLYPSTGATEGLTRPVCAPLWDTTTYTFFLESPTPVPASTTSSNPTSTTSTSTSPTSTDNTSTSTSTPTPTPGPVSKSPPKPIGAIVGGVVGGLAVIALTAIAILLLFRRRNRQPGQFQPAAGEAQFVQEQHPPPAAQVDFKHASYVNNYPTSPFSSPPIYHHSAAQSQPYFPSPTPGSPNPANGYGSHYPTSPQQAGSFQPSYGNLQTPAPALPTELPTYVPPAAGVAEMNTDRDDR